jgi:hypothetical protein
MLWEQRTATEREHFKEKSIRCPSFPPVSHVAMPSKHKDVADVILAAAASVKQTETTMSGGELAAYGQRSLLNKRSRSCGTIESHRPPCRG